MPCSCDRHWGWIYGSTAIPGECSRPHSGHLHHQGFAAIQWVGSGQGQQDFLSGTVNYGVSDIPLTPAQYSALGTRQVLQIPAVLNAVSVFVNITGVSKLILDPDTLARIFLGQITTFGDPAITMLNPGLVPPTGNNISIITRADNSGTTALFTSYLVKASPSVWNLGSGLSVNFPTTVRGVTGTNSVVAGLTAVGNSIGYATSGAGVAAGLTEVALRNFNGQYLTSVQADYQELANQLVLPAPTGDWSTVNLTYLAGNATYPVSGFSYYILDANQAAICHDLSSKSSHLAPGLRHGDLRLRHHCRALDTCNESSQSADDTWSSIVDNLQDATTIAMLHNMPDPDDLPTEMIARFREASRRPEVQECWQGIFQRRGLALADTSAKLADPAFLREISVEVQRGVQMALETSLPASAPQAEAPEPLPLKQALGAALGNHNLRGWMFEVLPPHLRNVSAVETAMSIPEDLAKLRGLLRSEQDSMDPLLKKILFHPESLARGSPAAVSSDSTSSAEQAADDIAAAEQLVADKLLDELMHSDELWQGIEPLLPKSEIPDRETFQEMVQNPVFRGQVVALLQNDPLMARFLRSHDLGDFTKQVETSHLEGRPSPLEFAARINANERLTSILSQPQVQEALARMAEDPEAIQEYKTDPQVMQAIKSLREIYGNSPTI
ncbi:hypothetical protein WJX84_005617 [Apatococcus fuscideae]|uniref:STI1 domain-containing protein n=1 Tax=Apatococcus fuscideae TaxID=2026836 RepID=A0AAW1TIS2_9CHLO